MKSPVRQRACAGLAAWLGRPLAWSALCGMALALGLTGCTSLPPPAANPATSPEATLAMREHPERLIVLAVANPQDGGFMLPGSTGASYGASSRYIAGATARLLLQAISEDHGLHTIAAWPIGGLRLHCVVVEIPAGASRKQVLAALAHDSRVELAQPLQSFDTLAAPDGVATSAPKGAPVSTPGRAASSLQSRALGGLPPLAYNDPYIDLQRGFSAIDAAGAQQLSRGRGVRIAVIDTGVDTGHPDLLGVVAGSRNFVDNDTAAFVHDRHGTEVAGIIAAVANNQQGIVGVAPDARLLAFKACWYGRAASAAAQCNSYTLAQALMAAIDSGAQVINLSLGGPADELLTRLLTLALRQGRIVVGAVPPQGGLAGFPVGVPGVIAVDSAIESPANSAANGATSAGAVRASLVATNKAVVAAPGRDILTLMPGGAYDFASGSSLATAHVSAAIALLLAVNPGLSAAAAQAALQASMAPASGRDEVAAINVCRALQSLRGGGHCAGPATTTAGSNSGTLTAR